MKDKIVVQDKSLVKRLMESIDLSSSSSIMQFGSNAQEEVIAISSNMLEGVKNKDLGDAGNSLASMVTAIRGFNVDELNPNEKQGFFDKLLGRAKPLAKFLSKYEDTQEQIESITDELEKQKGELLNDIESLDRLYDANLNFIYELEHYIAAGKDKIELLDTKDIPLIESKVEQSSDMTQAQDLRDLRLARDEFDARIHDLMLTRQVALQSLPSIRMIQENDKALVNKINSTLVNTVPLWKNQIAQTITIYRNQQAGKTLGDAMDLTNELLEANAKNLKDANRQARELAQRGVFDIKSIKLANELLIETIKEGQEIVEAGKIARKEAESELQNLETDLKKALLEAKASK